MLGTSHLVGSPALLFVLVACAGCSGPDARELARGPLAPFGSMDREERREVAVALGQYALREGNANAVQRLDRLSHEAALAVPELLYLVRSNDRDLAGEAALVLARLVMITTVDTAHHRRDHVLGGLVEFLAASTPGVGTSKPWVQAEQALCNYGLWHVPGYEFAALREGPVYPGEIVGYGRFRDGAFQGLVSLLQKEQEPDRRLVLTIGLGLVNEADAAAAGEHLEAIRDNNPDPYQRLAATWALRRLPKPGPEESAMAVSGLDQDQRIADPEPGLPAGQDPSVGDTPFEPEAPPLEPVRRP